MDGYARVATGPSFSPVENFRYYDWTAGGEVGLGLRIGSFHAGAAGGIRIAALDVILFAILGALIGRQNSPTVPDSSAFDELPFFVDFPLRFYAGVSLNGRTTTRVDGFWGWRLRVNNCDNPPDAKDYETGISLVLDWFLMETSYTWPQTKKLRVRIGGHWGF